MDGRNKVVGIILAGGDGTRINSGTVNKTALLFGGKPMIQYGANVFRNIVDQTIIVVGAYADSVKECVKGSNISFAYQKERLGTGHAVKIGLRVVDDDPDYVLVGYGDHMMFYPEGLIQDLINQHKKEKSVLTLISTEHENPNELAWGRIIRDKNNNVIKSVEQKDASNEEKKVKELNVGFYCFNCDFLRKNINKIKKSPVTNEYYLNALVETAYEQNIKISALKAPFEYIGIGINTQEQLVNSQSFYKSVRNFISNQ